MNDYVALASGIACAAAGGELFVRGVAGLAAWARVSRAIVAATIAAFATSGPELSVSVSAALARRPQIALGDALGSNVVNVALVLALPLLLSGIRTSRDAVRRDFAVALAVPVIAGIFLLDGVLSRIEGLVLLGAFAAWLIAAFIEARKQRAAAGPSMDRRLGLRSSVLCVVGLGFLAAAGPLIVTGARGIAASFGIDEFVIGATIVALGTSAPELATALIAKLRGHDDIGLGTVLGSNIFNGLFIVAVAAVIFPISVEWREVGVALACGFLGVLITFPTRGGLIPRTRGVLLLLLYAVYVALVIRASAAWLPDALADGAWARSLTAVAR